MKIEDKGQYCSIHSPELENGNLSFGDKRRLLVEFRQLESGLLYKGWNAYTKIGNKAMMRILWKLGAKPYHMDLEANSIWFYKEINNG